MAIDFGGLATTDNYSTAYTPKINEAVKALAYMLDPAYASYTGTPFTNAKRFNGGALEKFNGSIWVAQPLAGGYNGTVGATTPSTGAFTTLSASAQVRIDGASVNGLHFYNGATLLADLYDDGAAWRFQNRAGASRKWDFYVADTLRTSISSTGLAVTGDLSASGGLSLTGSNNTLSGSAGYLQILGSSGGQVLIDSQGSNTINIRPGGSAVGVFSSTGLAVTGAVVAAASDSAAGGYGFSGFTDYRIWASANNLNFRIGGAGTTFQVTNNGAAVTGTLTASKRAYTVSTSVLFSATPSFDANASNFHILGALTANVTSVTITNAQEGQFLTIRFTQDGTGGRTITTGNMGATNAPSISGSPTTTANKASYLNLTYNATAARWEGSWLGTT